MSEINLKNEKNQSPEIHAAENKPVASAPAAEAEKPAALAANAQKNDRESEFLEFKKALEELNRGLEDEQKAQPRVKRVQEADKWDKLGNDTRSAPSDCFSFEDEQKSAEKGELPVAQVKPNAQTKPDAQIKSVGTEDAALAKQISDVKYAKLMSKIDYDCTRPTLTTADIKSTSGALAEYGFKSICILASRMKMFKKKAADVNFCAVIGYPSGEMTENSKACEIKEAVRFGAAEVDVFFRTSSLKDDKPGAILRELKRYRRIIGKKKIFKLSFDCELVNTDEIRFIADTAHKAKADYLVVRNCRADKAKLQIAIAKTCSGKCKIEYADNVVCLADADRLCSLGADRFLLTEAKEFAKRVKSEI